MIARLWVPIISPFTHMVCLLPVLSYLVGFKGVSVRPPVRPGYDANTALEAIASSSGNIGVSVAL